MCCFFWNRPWHVVFVSSWTSTTPSHAFAAWQTVEVIGPLIRDGHCQLCFQMKDVLENCCLIMWFCCGLVSVERKTTLTSLELIHKTSQFKRVHILFLTTAPDNEINQRIFKATLWSNITSDYMGDMGMIRAETRAKGIETRTRGTESRTMGAETRTRGAPLGFTVWWTTTGLVPPPTGPDWSASHFWTSLSLGLCLIRQASPA